MSTRPKRRAAPSQKALDSAREEQRRREARRSENHVGFAAFGQQRAREVEAAAGEERPDRGDSDDEVEELPQPKAKQSKPRARTKWPPAVDFMLATAGESSPRKSILWYLQASDLDVTPYYPLSLPYARNATTHFREQQPASIEPPCLRTGAISRAGVVSFAGG